MWEDMLLQFLITFLPVFIFMFWYSQPERTGYIHILLSIVCGVSMLLNIYFSTAEQFGVFMDFRHVPLIIGSLYGGIPSAIILVILYVATGLFKLSTPWQLLMFAIYLVVFIPLLFSRISAFQRSGRSGRLHIIIQIYVVLITFIMFIYLVIFPTKVMDVPFNFYGLTLLHGGLFLAMALASVHLAELGYERIYMQIELRDVSIKYRNEMRTIHQFIDNTPLIVVFCNSRGLVTYAGEKVLKMVQPFGQADFINKEFTFLMERLGMEFEENPIERVMKSQERSTEMLIVHGRTYYTVTCPIMDTLSKGPECVGVLFIGHDVTELNRLRDEVDKMERLSLVGQMAASITHEIRNPMAVIRGFVQLMNERSSADQQSYFRIILDELDRANAIINDFLSLAQNRVVQKESCELHNLLNDLLPLVLADANMRGQIVDLSLCDHMDLLQMNTKEIKQLILNLTRNGMEAMNEKGVLRIETTNLEDMVQLRVIDNGVGIPEDKLERLFEPFYTTKTNGTGVGLPLCLSIVERHNGKIHVESKLGHGTTFIVSFCKPGKLCW